MCILFIYTDPNPQPNGYRLIIVSNRDEFYHRPSQPMSTLKNVVGGRDLFEGRSGGMWAGISLNRTEEAKLRFGALLNVTGEDRKHGLKGRGFIVTDYLEGNRKAKEYMDELLATDIPYNAFNFVTLEANDNISRTEHCSNKPQTYNRYDGKQVLGFGNTIPKTPPTKVVNGCERFKTIVDEFNSVDCRNQLIEELLKFLKWDKPHLPCAELEKRQPVFYKYLSCVYVKAVDVNYGTRTHSIILVDENWNVEFYEATMKDPIDPENPTWEVNTFTAKL